MKLRNEQSRFSGAVVGETPEIRNVCRIIEMAARTTRPVLIVGEPGTGKEVIARAIHSTGVQSLTPFRVCNCTTVQPNELERDLFRSIEYVEELERHDPCTLFLDRILDSSLELQAVLLRALQQTESPFWPDRSAPCRPRIIAASTCDFKSAVNEGRFRRDLYFRLNVLSLRVPPLRERRQDIPLLAKAFLDHLSCLSGHRFQLSDSALKAMLRYGWPGNVRELENCLECACVGAARYVITLFDLPIEIQGKSTRTDNDFPPSRVIPLSELERQSIEEALKLVEGDKKRAARLLGIGKTTLYRKLKEYTSGRGSQ